MVRPTEITESLLLHVPRLCQPTGQQRQQPPNRAPALHPEKRGRVLNTGLDQGHKVYSGTYSQIEDSLEHADLPDKDTIANC